MTIFEGHVVAAACMELGLDGPDSEWPSSAIGQVCVADLAQKVVTQCTIIPEAILGQPIKESWDGVYNYARVLCYFASLVAEFTDACSEGAGKRDTLFWKIFMLHFHTERRTKYALEALKLQLQLATLPPDLVHQLTWGRFVNTHGGPGMNIHTL